MLGKSLTNGTLEFPNCKNIPERELQVENAFGILAQGFRLYFIKIISKSSYIENIILTPCILHNFLRNGTSVLSESSSSIERNQPALPAIGNNARLEIFQVRETFTAFFNSEVGSV